MAAIVGHTAPGGSADLFIEHLQPPQAIVIFGAGPDAVPLVGIAKTLGWHVTIVGTRPASAMPQLFPIADAMRVTGSEAPDRRCRASAGLCRCRDDA